MNQDRHFSVEFDGVSKTLGTTLVLKNVNLRLPAGAICAIAGESGSGKSTLLRHVNGLLRNDTGVVRVFGRPVDYADLVRFRRGIGYAVQGIGLFPHLRAGENVSLLARLAGWPEPRIARRLANLLALMELDAEIAARFPHELSGGQQQRIGLCRALMLEPPLLLLDEAFSGIDPITREGIHARLLELHRAEPVSILLVTHDLAEARRLASHLTVLKGGQVVQSDALEVLTSDPADPYVERLLCTHS